LGSSGFGFDGGIGFEPLPYTFRTRFCQVLGVGLK
jgi:hypothetical protein